MSREPDVTGEEGQPPARLDDVGRLVTRARDEHLRFRLVGGEDLPAADAALGDRPDRTSCAVRDGRAWPPERGSAQDQDVALGGELLVAGVVAGGDGQGDLRRGDTRCEGGAEESIHLGGVLHQAHLHCAPLPGAE